MNKKKFEVQDWLDQPLQQSIDKEPKEVKTVTAKIVKDDETEIEEIIQQIETKQIDIATAYSDWRNIGFALGDSFGEAGRDYFHRISKFYNGYSSAECDLQYNKCLQSNGQGISLKTFFYHAKQAGINISPQVASTEHLPTLPDTIYPQLPEFLQKVVSVATFNEEKDILLLGTIVTLSACFPKLFGIYDVKKFIPTCTSLSLRRHPQAKVGWFIASR